MKKSLAAPYQPVECLKGASCTLLVSHVPATGMQDWNWAGEMKHRSTSREGKWLHRHTVEIEPLWRHLQSINQTCRCDGSNVSHAELSLKRYMVDISFLLEHPSDNAGTSNWWLPRMKMSSVECHYAEDQMLQFFLSWCSRSFAWRYLFM